MTTSIIDKRDRDEAEAMSVIDFKRQRFVDLDGPMKHRVGEYELASAFALASLASMNTSPTTTYSLMEAEEQIDESRDADHHEGDTGSEAQDGERSPVRSPSKRVTFSNDTKETSREIPRKLSLPPRTKNQPPQNFAVFSPPGHEPFRNSQMPPPMPRMRQQHSMVDHDHCQFIQNPTTTHTLPADKWICDFCNVAAFDSYEEACVHEESCRVRCKQQSWSCVSSPGSQHLPMFPPPEQHCVVNPNYSMIPAGVIHSESRPWFGGTKSLAIPGTDADWLSGLNCFVREHCVEAFSATQDDVSKSSKRGRISLHQVGIRCCFCSHRPKEETPIAAVSYPLSVAGIYESVKRWQKVHLDQCEDVPRDVKVKLQVLSAKNVWIPTTRPYWADSARSLGMVDTEGGIRFALDPIRGPSPADPPSAIQSSPAKLDPVQEEMSTDGEGNEGSTSALTEGNPVVFSDDMPLVPPYVYFLMRQVEYTRFTEADRFVARSKGPVGYAGFQCRHCHGHAGLGKYFPISSKSFSTNSTSQNVHSHLLKCRKVNPYVKNQLVALKEEKGKAPRLEPGWRRVFFEKIWTRLHG